MSESVSDEQLATLAAALDLDVMTTGICQACLSFVSFPLADGDTEGLEVPVRVALERAGNTRIPGATAALKDVESRGGRSRVVRPIVLRLAADLAKQAEPAM